VGSLCHFCATPTHLSYRFSIFETSATALCGTTGMIYAAQAGADRKYQQKPLMAQTCFCLSHVKKTLAILGSTFKKLVSV